MNVLAIDGALGQFSAAVASGGTIASSVALEGNVALEAGLAGVRDVMASAGVRANDVQRIAVGIGPGGFTGLRITVTYAKALAQAWKLPLAGISSFDILEYGRTSSRVLSIVVGRAGIISARYREGGDERRASGPVTDVLRVVLPSADARPLDVVGAPEDVLACLAEGGFIVNALPSDPMPPACALALAGARARVATNIHEVRADYGEAPAAKVPSFRPTGRGRT
jgi:tRNA threonylcarbamoyl adenosine modification protein YeaZ